MTIEDLPPCWQSQLRPEFEAEYFVRLHRFVTEERRRATVYPPPDEVFAAFRLTRLADVKVLILGQDPYHGDGQACGLCFSVRPGVPQPPSLRNIFRELRSDVGCPIPMDGCLQPWAAQGVLLLNAVLTVRAGAANSHADHGWEQFTDAAIDAVNAGRERVVFVLWGAYAGKKAQIIDQSRHVVLTSAHPSPLSAHRGFFGSKPFSRINDALMNANRTAIRWELGKSGVT